MVRCFSWAVSRFPTTGLGRGHRHRLGQPESFRLAAPRPPRLLVCQTFQLIAENARARSAFIRFGHRTQPSPGTDSQQCLGHRPNPWGAEWRRNTDVVVECMRNGGCYWPPEVRRRLGAPTVERIGSDTTPRKPNEERDVTPTRTACEDETRASRHFEIP